MNYNYIKCDQAETIQKLKNLGFVVLSEEKGVTTFLNMPHNIENFEELPIVYTNKMNC